MNNRFHPKYNAHLQTYVELLLSILQNITCYTLDINDLIVTSRLNGYTTGGTIDKKKNVRSSMSSNRRAKFFSVSSFGLSQISNRSSYFFFLCPCLAVLESSSETLNGCLLTRPNKLVMPNSDWLLYTFVKQILQIGLIIFVCEHL